MAERTNAGAAAEAPPGDPGRLVQQRLTEQAHSAPWAGGERDVWVGPAQ
ncbi:hypothetical protein [Streptomyces sp. NPDC052107]